MNENNIKALFPKDVETITISKNDYDRLYGQLTYKNIILQSKIDKISEYVDKIYDVMDYKDYPPYLDEIYYTLHPELKEDK